MEWLRYGRQHYPNRICINEYTYRDIYIAVVHVATRLQALPDTRIAIVSDNSATMAVYLLAAMLVCKEVLLLNVHLTVREIEKQLCQLHITTAVSYTHLDVYKRQVEHATYREALRLFCEDALRIDGRIVHYI